MVTRTDLINAFKKLSHIKMSETDLEILYKELNKADSKVVFPAILQDPQISKLWEEFCILRKEKRKPLTGPALKRIFKKLEGVSVADAVLMFDSTLENSYTSIYKLKAGTIQNKTGRQQTEFNGNF